MSRIKIKKKVIASLNRSESGTNTVTTGPITGNGTRPTPTPTPTPVKPKPNQ